MAIPVVKSEVVQGGWPQHISQSIASKYLCQILDALKTNRGKLGQRLFSSQGWVWVTEMFSFFYSKYGPWTQRHQHHRRVVSNPESQTSHMLLRIYILSRSLGDLRKKWTLVDSVVIRINLSNFSTYWHVPRWSLSGLHILQSYFSKSHFKNTHFTNMFPIFV